LLLSAGRAYVELKYDLAVDAPRESGSEVRLGKLSEAVVGARLSLLSIFVQVEFNEILRLLVHRF
jgi:hypothetical protein